MERIKRKHTDIIIFISVLILGIISTIFWNKIAGILISISSLIPIHQEIISVASKLLAPEDKSSKKTAQKIKNSHGAIQVIAEEDSVVHINQNMTQKKKRKK